MTSSSRVIFFCSLLLWQLPNRCASQACTSSSLEAKVPFPEVLSKAGKTVFRPGGTVSTQKLWGWASLLPKKNADCKVLEMAAGRGGLDLASSPGCHVLLIDKDEQKLQRIENIAKRKKLRIKTRQVDLMSQTSGSDLASEGPFDAVIFEASLSQYPDHAKRRILKELRKSSPQVLLHELGLKQHTVESKTAADVIDRVGSALGLPHFAPLTLSGWKALLHDCGYTITHQECGPLRTFNPKTMIQDEGAAGAATIAYNLATHRGLRERILSTKAVLTSHSDQLGYILVRAVRDE